MTHKNLLKSLTLPALFLALGLFLPFFTGQIPQVGNMLLPMHIPVLLCGIVCGWRYGMGLGFVLPLLRFALFSMPPLYPTGISMAFELATYGAVAGLLYAALPRRRWSVYGALAGAMVAGRIVWGIARLLLSGVGGSPFTWELFMAGALFTAVPGIVVQLTLVPMIIFALQKTGAMEHEQGKSAQPAATQPR